MNKKFRRTLAGLTAFLMAFSAAAIPQVADKIGLSITASAAATMLTTQHVENGIKYAIYNDNTAKVYGNVNSTSFTDVTIPEKVTYNNKEYTVTAVGNNAFRSCSNLKNVTIPNTVTAIENGAFSGCTALTSITLPDSVTTIGDNAFNGCKGLTRIEIPENVTTIGEQAFIFCTNLESVTIPGSVKSIGVSAFADCFKLSNVTIPEGVNTIGDFAFQYCGALESVSIPSSVTSIGNGAFASCYKLTTITLAEGNESYLVEGNVLFNKDKTELVAYPGGKAGTSYTIPNGVTTIKESAFENCYLGKLESIVFSDTVTTIEDNAFKGCYYFTSFEIPSSVTSLGEGVFNQCNNLTAITVAAENSKYSAVDGVLFDKEQKTLIAYPCGKSDTSYTIPDGVVTIANDAFYDCNKITSVTIPASVKTIGDNAFLRCEKLATVTISEGVNSIGNSAFNQCNSLESIKIPESVTSIGENAFVMCSGLKSVEMGNGVTEIGRFIFQSCSALESVTLSDKITEISDQAFFGCSALKELTIPDGVIKIGSWAFNNCSGLTSLTIPNGVTEISGGAFYGCSGLTSLTIPSGVTELGGSTFDGCTNLKTLTLPECFNTENVKSRYGISESTEIIFSSNAVTFDSKYVTVTKSDSTPVENGAELDDGVELTITVTVPTGMKLNSVKANGETLTAESDGTYKYTTSGGAAIVADVVAKEYPLAITSSENAAIVVKDEDGNPLENGAAIKYGDKFTVEVTPAVGYKTTAVSVENATLSDGYYTVNNDVADEASITVSATVEEKVFTITSLPENVTLLKNDEDEVTADANNTFKKGDKITIFPHSGYDMVMVPSVGDKWATGDGQGNAYYIFTGEETEGEFTIFSGVQKCFKIDTTKVPENTKLYLRMEVGGEKSARAATEIVDYEVKAGTSFYEGYMLVIKIDEDCTVFGDVKVGDTTVTADENGEYVYTFTGNEDNQKPIVVSADVKKNTCEVTFSGMTVKKEDGTELESGDKVAEGTKLIISGWPSAGAICKSGGFTVNDVAAEKLENGDYTYTVKAEDTKIEIKEIVYYVKDIEVTGLSDTYYVGDELEVEIKNDKVCIKGASIKFVFDDDSKSDEYPLYESAVKNFDTSKPNDTMKFTIDCGGDKKDITVKVEAVVPTKIEVSSNFKKLYQADEALDVSGGKISVTYNNGKTAVKDITADMVTGFDAETENGHKDLTVTYTENGVTQTTTYGVDICDDDLTVDNIAVSGYKTEYYVGDEFDASEGKITVNYTTDSLFDEIGLAAAEIMGFDSSAAAESLTITVKYGGKETTFTVKINAVSVTSAALTKPTKTDYKTGDRLNLDGGKLTVVYSSGKIENIPLTDSRVSVTGFSSSKTGTQEITVKFGEIEKKYSVYVTASSSSGGSGGSSGGGSYGGGSSSGGSSSTTTTPSIDGKETTWADVASDISKLTEGKTETIDLNGGKTVPVEVVKAIATSNAEVTLKVDEVFSWTIDGSDIDPKDAKAADFSITKTTVVADNTPRGTRGTSFSVKGTNVKSELNINFKSTHSGEFANLYKKVDGKLVFVDNVKVDKNGAAIGLEVSDKGEYVVMLGKYSDRAGDMDNDGILNAKDSLAILKNYLEIEEGENPLVADINGDGFINAKDALQVLIKYLNIE